MRTENNREIEDLTGKIYGHLKVVSYSRSDLVHTFWNCICDCGKVVEKRRNALIKNTKSCGCKLSNRGKTGLDYGENNFNRLYRTYKRGAEQRGYAFNLDVDNFRKLTKGNCFYCGSEPSNIVNEKQSIGEYVYNGIDRIDNKIGYEIDNCVSCCSICNKMKWELDIDAFYKHIQKIIGMKKCVRIY